MQTNTVVDEYAPSLARGFAAGLVAALIGAVVWAAITAITDFQIGFMAIGVGFLVGHAVLRYGQGDDMMYGVIGALLALFGCLLGNYLADAIIFSRVQDAPFLAVFMDFPLGIEMLKATTGPIDLLFYAIALWQGYSVSIDAE